MATRAPSPVLDTRALNRALLARQHLLARAATTPTAVLEHLVGLQAQAPNPPYVGLWTRLARFVPADLSRLVTGRRVVRIALQRSTLHLVTARDALVVRPVVQPVIVRATMGGYRRLLAGMDLDALAAAGRALVEARPRTLAEIGAALHERWPERDPRALAMAVRAFVPLVQVPPRGLWGESGQAAHTSLEAWVGRPLAADAAPDALVLRYLGAFGPATARDVQAWSGLTGVREVMARLRSRLVSYRGERGEELFDLPDAPRPDADVPAPVRLLPEWDNVLLSHADRTRIVPAAHRDAIFSLNGIIRATVLVDGFVRATWRLERARGGATLVVEPLVALRRRERAAVEEEALALLAFAAAGAPAHAVRFATA